MIVTARQIEDLYLQNGANGSITLPYRARLTPLAQDWVRARKIALGFSDVAPAPPVHRPPFPSPGIPGEGRVGVGKGAAQKPELRSAANSSPPMLWWCDGPCGPAKAAVVAFERESNFRPLDMPAEPAQLVRVIRTIASLVKSDPSTGAVLLVQNAAAATVFANRCPSLRAVLGTCLEAVEQGVRQVAANVLIIEYPYKTLPQIRNLLSRFVRGGRELPADVRHELQELASCG